MEWLKYIFGYSLDPSDAFFFNRFDFWLFFTAMILLYSFIYRKPVFRNLYLTVFSLFFYFKSGGFYFIILLFSTLVDFFIGKWIHKSDSQKRKKLLVTTSVVINLAVLAYFKYAVFFTTNINEWLGTDFHAVDIFAQLSNALTGSNFNIESIFLPIGISFYTFQTISYSIDVYRGHVKPVRNIMDFAFYVSFFPQLVAGPIVRASDFVPQIYEKYEVNKAEMGRALFLIISGMIKKILIADYLGANFVGGVFEDPTKYTGFQNLMAIYGFALQIYGDFSGYTDIAIGIALLLGFRLPLNFNSPYKAINITDFWRRWHISLSSWLRDYLYIPLGGNRKGKFNTYRNLFITMLLGGLWHGAAWRFIFWGAMHGGALAVHKLYAGLPFSRPKNSFFNIVAGVVTFHFVCFCWVFFAAKDMNTGWVMINQIFVNFYPELVIPTIISYKKVFIVMAIGFIVHLLPQNIKEMYTVTFVKLPDVAKVGVMVVVAIFLYQVMAAGIQPFIYFQF